VENIVEPYRPQNKQIWRMRIICWINKTIENHSELLFSATLGKEKGLKLRYKYIAFPVKLCNFLLRIRKVIVSNPDRQSGYDD
jgi:hypothetical protein